MGDVAQLASSLMGLSIFYYTRSEFERSSLKGEVLFALRPSEPAVVESLFRRALAITQAQEAQSLQLRAATSLARLLRDQGRRAEARAELAPVYGGFTEGFDTRDLREAKGVLQDLAA